MKALILTLKTAGEYIAKFMDGMISIAGYVGSALIIVGMLVTSYDVVLRYIFNSPTVWAVPVSGAILLWSTLLLASWVLREDQHVKMDLILERLQPRRKALTNCATSVLGIAACIIILWKGIAITWHAFYKGEVESIGMFALPSWVVLLGIPLGMVFVIWEAVKKFRIHLGQFVAFDKAESENSIQTGGTKSSL
jgi:TRAP-type C4-dicarboxylate transport system permease small subunit